MKLAKEYPNIRIISLGLIFVQKTFLVDLFLRECIFGGLIIYWRDF